MPTRRLLIGLAFATGFAASLTTVIAADSQGFSVKLPAFGDPKETNADDVLFYLRKFKRADCVSADDINERDRLVDFATSVAFAYRNKIRSLTISLPNSNEEIQREGYVLNKLVVFTAQVKRLPVCGLSAPPAGAQ